MTVMYTCSALGVYAVFSNLAWLLGKTVPVNKGSYLATCLCHTWEDSPCNGPSYRLSVLLRYGWCLLLPCQLNALSAPMLCCLPTTLNLPMHMHYFLSVIRGRRWGRRRC